MKKTLFNRENIEKIVRLVPRPTMNGKLIARSRNFWLVLQEDEDGVEFLNKITNHGGKIPHDSIREWRDPDMTILSAQLNLGKDGVFELTPFLDGPETEMLTEDEEIMPERKAHAEEALGRCSTGEKEILKELLMKETMQHGEIHVSCSRVGLKQGYKFVSTISGRTSFLDSDAQKVWIKPAFVPVLQKLLLRPKTDSITTPPQPPQSS